MAKLITNSKDHKRINGFELTKLREKAGISQVQLGERVGMLMGCDPISGPYISRFELFGRHEIKTELADAIVLALDKNYT